MILCLLRVSYGRIYYSLFNERITSMKNIISKLIASAMLVLFFAGLASATPVYIKFEGVDGEMQVAEVDQNGACSFKLTKPGKYKASLLLPAVQKIRESPTKRANASDDSHKETIEIASWLLGASNQSSVGSSGMSAGKASYSDLSVMNSTDKSSPQLAKASSTGPVKAELKKQTTHNGDSYYVVKMTDVLVSSWQVSGQGSGDPVPTESISLNFTKIQWNYKPQNADAPAIPKGSWNQGTNVK